MGGGVTVPEKAGNVKKARKYTRPGRGQSDSLLLLCSSSSSPMTDSATPREDHIFENVPLALNSSPDPFKDELLA